MSTDPPRHGLVISADEYKGVAIAVGLICSLWVRNSIFPSVHGEYWHTQHCVVRSATGIILFALPLAMLLISSQNNFAYFVQALVCGSSFHWFADPRNYHGTEPFLAAFVVLLYAAAFFNKVQHGRYSRERVQSITILGYDGLPILSALSILHLFVLVKFDPSLDVQTGALPLCFLWVGLTRYLVRCAQLPTDTQD